MHSPMICILWTLCLLNTAVTFTDQTLSVIRQFKPAVFYQPGDILIGIVADISLSDDFMTCNNNVFKIRRPAEIEVYVHATNVINNNPNILPNVTLGFVVVDGCTADLTYLAATTYLLRNKICCYQDTCGTESLTLSSNSSYQAYLTSSNAGKMYELHHTITRSNSIC